MVPDAIKMYSDNLSSKLYIASYKACVFQCEWSFLNFSSKLTGLHMLKGLICLLTLKFNGDKT